MISILALQVSEAQKLTARREASQIFEVCQLEARRFIRRVATHVHALSCPERAWILRSRHGKVVPLFTLVDHEPCVRYPMYSPINDI